MRAFTCPDCRHALNRCMGADDISPFALPPAVVEKPDFVDALVRAARAG